MPVIANSDYSPPLFLSNGHFQTIIPSFFREVEIPYQRERIDTPDGDFLDLDWSKVKFEKLVIISHGLEGSTDRAYIKGMARAFNAHGWDALAWNYRGCSGVPNLKLRTYHSGATDDLETVILHASSHDQYVELCLVGFSMGGNINLKYLGEIGDSIPGKIKSAIAFSVPCDLKSSAKKLAQFSNRIYIRRFLGMLHEKIQLKMELFPDEINDDGFNRIKTFKEFDDRYTAPIHGFEDAEDYWRKCSSKQFLDNIRIPTLLINSKNDPFLTDSCCPIEQAQSNPNLFLEIPESGGHVGFISLNSNGMYWSESKAVSFANRQSKQL